MRAPWRWPHPWRIVSALVVGSLGGVALLVWLTTQRSQLVVDVESWRIDYAEPIGV